MQYVKGTLPTFDTIIILKWENGLEYVVIYKFIDKSHIGNLEFTCLDHCGDPNIYNVGTNNKWMHSMHDVFLVNMVHIDGGGKIMLHHTSLSEIKSQLYLSIFKEFM